jgi:hypothetical protein
MGNKDTQKYYSYKSKYLNNVGEVLTNKVNKINTPGWKQIKRVPHEESEQIAEDCPYPISFVNDISEKKNLCWMVRSCQ